MSPRVLHCEGQAANPAIRAGESNEGALYDGYPELISRRERSGSGQYLKHHCLTLNIISPLLQLPLFVSTHWNVTKTFPTATLPDPRLLMWQHCITLWQLHLTPASEHDNRPHYGNFTWSRLATAYWRQSLHQLIRLVADTRRRVWQHQEINPSLLFSSWCQGRVGEGSPCLPAQDPAHLGWSAQLPCWHTATPFQWK